VSSFLRKDKGASRTGRKLWQSATMFIYSPTSVEAAPKVLFAWAFAAHTQLSLTFLHNILWKWLISLV